MHKQLGLVLLLTSFFSLVKLAHAEVNVNVTNSVNTNSNSSSSTNVIQNSSGTSKTTIRVETNGEVHEFEAEGDESINWTSDDGNSSVKVNNNSSSNSVSVTSSANGETVVSTSNITPTPTQGEEKKSSTSADKKEVPNEKEARSFFEIILSFLSSFFK